MESFIPDLTIENKIPDFSTSMSYLPWLQSAIPVDPGNSPSKYIIVSVTEAQSLDLKVLRERNLTTDTFSSFCVVRYGTQEKRTNCNDDTIQPRWNASFVFEYQESASHITFLFFTEDPISGLSDIFGYIVIPIKEDRGSLSIVLMRDLVPIIGCTSSALFTLRDRATNLPTWPQPHSGLTKTESIGLAKISVVLIQLNDLPDLLAKGADKGAGVKGSKPTPSDSGLKDVLEATHFNVTSIMKALIRASPNVAGRMNALNKDRRKNPDFPSELSKLALAEVEAVVEQISSKDRQDRSLSRNKSLDDDSSVEKERSLREAAESKEKAALATVASLHATIASLKNDSSKASKADLQTPRKNETSKVSEETESKYFYFIIL